MSPQTLRFSACLLLTAALPYTGHSQGALTPPGAPAPTMKSLDQVEPRTPISALPFTITVPGSYYLTRNLSAPAGETGIQIDSDNVTVDLNGFALLGNGGAPGIVLANHRNIAVHNGTVTGWSRGIFGSNVASCEFAKLRLAQNSEQGLHLFNVSGINVRDCIFDGNAGLGLLGRGLSVIGCTARGNGDTGMSVERSTVTGCTSINNGGTGFDAVETTITESVARGNGTGAGAGNGFTVFDSNISRCVAGTNKDNGIAAGGDSFVHANNCNDNGTGPGLGAGIHVTGDGNRIEENNTAKNEVGIRVVNEGNLIIKNSSRGGSDAYDIAPGNSMGREITVTNTTISNANNNSDPWANFAY